MKVLVRDRDRAFPGVLGGAGTSIRSASSRPRCQGKWRPDRRRCGAGGAGCRRGRGGSGRLRRAGSGLGEDAEGVGVADAVDPLVDGVVGGRGDEDVVGIRDRGAPGLTYWLRTGLPTWSAIAAASKKSSAAGVAMTWTVQPRSWASLTQMPTAAAGPAPQATRVRTWQPGVTSGHRSWWQTAPGPGRCSPDHNADAGQSGEGSPSHRFRDLLAARERGLRFSSILVSRRWAYPAIRQLIRSGWGDGRW